MTLQHMIEFVMQVAPQVSDVQVTLTLNAAYKSFCSESRFLRGTANITIDPSVFTYAFPASIESLTSLDILDASGAEVHHHASYTLKDRFITLTHHHGHVLSVMIKDAAAIRVSGVMIPAPLVALTDVPVIPEQFHFALVSKATEGLAAQGGAMPLAQYHAAAYKNALRDAKILAAHTGDDTAYQPTIDTY